MFPQHPTQQVPQVQDPIEDENDTDIEYVSTETPELSGEGTPDTNMTTPAHLVYTDENEVFETTFEGKSTKCSSVLCLESIPASWKISDVFNFLQKCGILFAKMCEQSSAFIDQQNNGSKKAQVKFLNKMYAIFAKKKIEVSTHKPPVMTQIYFVPGLKPCPNRLFLAMGNFLPSNLGRFGPDFQSRSGMPKTEVRKTVICANIVLDIEFGNSVKSISVTVQNNTVVYMRDSNNVSLEIFFELLTETIMSPLKGQKISKAICIAFNSSKKRTKKFAQFYPKVVISHRFLVNFVLQKK